MKKIAVIYHQEQGSWWAESPDVPSFFATGESHDIVRAHVYEYLPRVVGTEIELFPEVEIPAAGPSLVDEDNPDHSRRFGGLHLPGMTAETS